MDPIPDQLKNQQERLARVGEQFMGMIIAGNREWPQTNLGTITYTLDAIFRGVIPYEDFAKITEAKNTSIILKAANAAHQRSEVNIRPQLMTEAKLLNFINVNHRTVKSHIYVYLVENGTFWHPGIQDEVVGQILDTPNGLLAPLADFVSETHNLLQTEPLKVQSQRYRGFTTATNRTSMYPLGMYYQEGRLDTIRTVKSQVQTIGQKYHIPQMLVDGLFNGPGLENL